jgi:hypothetical protein
MIPSEYQIIVALDPLGRASMKRDMKLVREILLAIQARTGLEQSVLELEGHDKIVVARHVEMMFSAGLIEGAEFRSNPAQILVKDLSWDGHDFLAALENKDVWSKIKKSFSAAELAALPLIVLKDVGIDLLKDWAKKKIGGS